MTAETSALPQGLEYAHHAGTDDLVEVGETTVPDDLLGATSKNRSSIETFHRSL